jgi:hypothetical protein
MSFMDRPKTPKDYETMMREAAEQQMRAMQNVYPQGASLSASLGQANMHAPMSPVAAEVQGLYEMVDTLHKRFTTLEERLRPVLMSGPECPSAGTSPATASTGVPLADQLRSTFDMAAQLRDRMETLAARIAL